MVINSKSVKKRERSISSDTWINTRNSLLFDSILEFLFSKALLMFIEGFVLSKIYAEYRDSFSRVSIKLGLPWQPSTQFVGQLQKLHFRALLNNRINTRQKKCSIILKFRESNLLIDLLYCTILRAISIYRIKSTDTVRTYSRKPITWKVKSFHNIVTGMINQRLFSGNQSSRKHFLKPLKRISNFRSNFLWKSRIRKAGNTLQTWQLFFLYWFRVNL